MIRHVLAEHWRDEEPTGVNGEKVRLIRKYGEGPVEERKMQEKWWFNLQQDWNYLRYIRLERARVEKDSDYGRYILGLEFEDISGGRIKAANCSYEQFADGNKWL